MDVDVFAKRVANIPFKNKPQRVYVYNLPLFRILRFLPLWLVDRVVYSLSGAKHIVGKAKV